MRPYIIAVFGASAVFGAMPAAAQDATWTGPYVGGRLGYTQQPKDKNEIILFDNDLDGAFGDTVRTASGANAFSTGFCGGRSSDPRATNCRDDDGTEWAVHAGYDMALGPLVVGIVGEYGRADIADGVSAFSTTPAVYTFNRRLRDTAAVRARAGYAFGRTLVYGTGGLAYGKIQRSFTTSNTVNTFTSDGGKKDNYGYRVGGGVEHRFNGGFSLGVQYLYTSLKDEGFTVRASGANVPVSNPFILRNAAGTDFQRSGNRFTSSNVSVVASFRF
ncbi:MAG TPA: outer membrane beta-barrel protein [Allosphingosinicella sp.]|jgi:outer membrane immunogenic protein